MAYNSTPFFVLALYSERWRDSPPPPCTHRGKREHPTYGTPRSVSVRSVQHFEYFESLAKRSSKFPESLRTTTNVFTARHSTVLDLSVCFTAHNPTVLILSVCRFVLTIAQRADGSVSIAGHNPLDCQTVTLKLSRSAMKHLCSSEELQIGPKRTSLGFIVAR